MTGLKELYLVGVRVRECQECGSETLTIPKMGHLLEAITDSLLESRALLPGDGIRFLRKRTNISVERFARLLATVPADLSMVESGKKPVSEPLDRLTRAIVAIALSSDAAHEIVVERGQKLQQSKAPLSLTFSKGGWVATN